ncbi:MAG: PAS domain-containing protein [Gammaproteobacteria bacterium]
MNSEFYKSLFTEHPDPMWIFEAETHRFVAVNQAALDKYGYSRDEFLALTLHDIRPAEDVDRLQQAIKTFAGGAADAGVWRHRKKNGEVFQVDIRTRVVRYDNLNARLVSARDVTQQVALEQEREELIRREQASRARAEEAARHFQMLFEGLPGRFLVLKPGTWEITAVSDAYLEATMTRREDIKGRKLFDVFPDDPAEPAADGTRMLRASLQRVEASGATDVMPVQRYPIPRPAECGGGFEERFWSAMNTPVRGPDGRITCIVHRAEDVTEFVKDPQQGLNMLEDRRAQMQLDIMLRARELADTNARLLQQQMVFRNVQRLVQLGTWQLNLDTRVLSWSDDVYAICGVDKAAFAHTFEAFMALVHPEDVPLLLETRATALRDGTPFDIEHRMRHPDGTVRYVREVGEILDTPQGRLFSGVILDLTAQRETELRLRDTLESMTDAFFTLDRNWRFRFINSEFTRIIGVGRKQLLGRDVWDCFPEARGTQFQRSYEEALNTGKAVTFVEYLPGYDKWLRVRAYPGPDGLAVYFQDITQERAQEAAARISEERFTSIAKATYDIVWDWNMETDEIWWNLGFTALTGHDPVALGGTSTVWTNFIHPDDLQRVVDGIYAVIDGTESSWRDEYRYICADGRVLVVMDRGYVIRDELGKARRMVGSMVDVTELRELAQKLQQSQKLESIGQLTGGIAHDFNNLLTVVMGNAETLEEQLEGQPRLLALAHMITRASQRGAELTNRLLAFARRQVLEPKVIDLAQQLTGMDALLRHGLTEDIDIRMLHVGQSWLVEVDPGQFEVAMLNLAINARDAMPDGGSLTIETSNVTLDEDYVRDNPDASPGRYVVVSVTDTGTGMSPEVLARAFEPFFTTKEAGKGNGLGLSMVYGFVKQSGGVAKIYSEQGEGTTIRLYFPRSGNSADSTADNTFRQAGSDNDRGRGEQILVVEDDDNVRTHVCQLLEDLDYRVLCARNGAEALDLLRSPSNIDLLLTDVVMPGGMSGAQLAEQAVALRPGLPVLFTSGYPQNSIAHQGRLQPGVELLSKPYRKSQLAAKVRRVLDQR